MKALRLISLSGFFPRRGPGAPSNHAEAKKAGRAKEAEAAQ